MVRKKKLSPTGMKNEDGEYSNANISLNKDELEVAGLEIGDEVIVRARKGMLVIQKPGESQDIQHEFGE